MTNAMVRLSNSIFQELGVFYSFRFIEWPYELMAEKPLFDSTNLKQKLMRLIEFDKSDRVRAALAEWIVRQPNLT